MPSPSPEQEAFLFNPIRRTKTSAMINGDGEGCAIEVAANSEPKFFD